MGYIWYMDKLIKQNLQRRLNIIKGQVEGLQKMVGDERYCPDIITQSMAIQKSLASVNKSLLENHVRTHLAHQLASHESSEIDQAVAEMLKLYELSNVRGGTK